MAIIACILAMHFFSSYFVETFLGDLRFAEDRVERRETAPTPLHPFIKTIAAFKVPYLCLYGIAYKQQN